MSSKDLIKRNLINYKITIYQFIILICAKATAYMFKL
ncbi:hypothetical protein Slin_5379 [Spirosoma linguale DSM 74]|uniref:Uncharacterized protein n=1 Tax=Spirosoma linguale (strain ATCC 33905 / DSM 74 / LMG 10896 / Claus 1) TaxID=504472 RepID=D2QF02_SPILD|nr:hypothetical protein Slin_5379 [Spirosoma linguale DSM 74]